jgi:hypothetical protein
MGTIYLPGSRVTVGRNGQVSADICAREVVILGAVHGNIDAGDRVNKGLIDIRTPGQGNDGMVAPGSPPPTRPVPLLPSRRRSGRGHVFLESSCLFRKISCGFDADRQFRCAVYPGPR